MNAISTSTSSLRTSSEARWIDLGRCEARYFHAAYEGLARAQSADAPPMVLWGQPGAHISIGCTQDRRAEVVPVLGVPVLRRALGGGAVWVDEGQFCVVLIAPSMGENRAREDFADRALDAAAATMRSLGLAAERCERDIWVCGKKIAGSGSGTIGNCFVLGFSFLLRFAPERFAQALTLAHEGLRSWLIDALALTLTDWTHEAAPPTANELSSAFRCALREHLGWRTRASRVARHEHPWIRDAHPEAGDDWVYDKRRRAPEGLRLNARSFLRSRLTAQGYEDCLVVNGHTVRVCVHGRAEH